MEVIIMITSRRKLTDGEADEWRGLTPEERDYRKGYSEEMLKLQMNDANQGDNSPEVTQVQIVYREGKCPKCDGTKRLARYGNKSAGEPHLVRSDCPDCCGSRGEVPL